MWETERSSLSLKSLKLFPALCKHSDTNVSQRLHFCQLFCFWSSNLHIWLWLCVRAQTSLGRPDRNVQWLVQGRGPRVWHPGLQVCFRVKHEAETASACDSSWMYSWFYFVVLCWSHMCSLSVVSWTGNRDSGFIHAHRDFIKATSDKQHGDKHGITVWKALRDKAHLRGETERMPTNEQWLCLSTLRFIEVELLEVRRIDRFLSSFPGKQKWENWKCADGVCALQGGGSYLRKQLL